MAENSGTSDPSHRLAGVHHSTAETIESVFVGDDETDAPQPAKRPALKPIMLTLPPPAAITPGAGASFSKPAPVEDEADEDGDELIDDDDATVETTDTFVTRTKFLRSLPSKSDRWTIPLLCAGIGLISACLLIPEADANRRMVYERQRLQADLESLRKQVDLNGRFLDTITNDANLAERLAQRQLKYVREGTKILPLDGMGEDEMSPFNLVAVKPPPTLPPYEPRGGFITSLLCNPRPRLHLMGVGLFMMAAALVLGAPPKWLVKSR